MSASRIRIPESLRPLAALAARLGWVISQAGSGHLRWEAPDGKVVITSATPSCKRGKGSRNDRARLRKAGLRLETS